MSSASRTPGTGQATLELLLFDVATGRRLVRGQGTVPTDIGMLEQGVQRAVAGAFEAALRPQQAGDNENIPAVVTNTEQQPQTAAPVGPSTPFYEEWWFWTIIAGVVVAGLAVGLGLGLSNQGPPLANDPGGQVIFTF